ncbi:hypothetical protein B484DRAFT_398923 [Ochromonadaceae sp. CCMP2298]|nr:hypothetical protein B484DRAFT_398923 [Ochromonadaceae sp. CCMP2298]
MTGFSTLLWVPKWALGQGAEGDSAERKAAVHKAAVQQLRAILKPLLSRKFLQLEAAPILQEFMKSSNSSSMGLEGAAAELSSARHGDSGSKSTASASGGDSNSGADYNSKRISGVPALPSSDDIINDLAEQKAALEAKIEEMKGSGTPVWGRSDSSIVDLVLLEKADRLWGLLQATVHSAIHGGVYALLSMCGAGNQPAPAQKGKPFSFF